MIYKCKKCDNTNLVEFKDQPYFRDSEYVKQISGVECFKCGAIFSIVDEKLDFWEFPVGNYKENTNQVAGWAQN